MKGEGGRTPKSSNFMSFVRQLKHFSKQVLYLRSQILPQREPAGHEI